MGKMEKRREIDFVNVFMCLLVMMIHCLSQAVGALNRESVQYAMVFVPWRLASFVVQGFIFLSALKYFMKLKRGGGLEYGHFLLSRAKTIVLPYILWNLIYYFALIPLGYFIFDPRTFLGEMSGYLFLGNMISHFYFVVIIVQFYALMPFWVWVVKRVRGVILIPLSLAVMVVFGQYMSVPYNDRIFLKYIFYWICGCYAGLNYDAFISFIKKWGWVMAVAFGAMAVLDAGLTLLAFSGRMAVRGLENIHIAYSAAAVAFLFTMAVWKTGKIVDNCIFGILNRQSYNIYLSHCLFLYYADYGAGGVGVGSVGAALVVRTAVCLTLTFVLWGAYDCIKRLKMHKSGC